MGRNTMSEESTGIVVDRSNQPVPSLGVLTVAGMVYHRESPTEEATSHDLTFSRVLSTQEQPYGPRKCKVDENWTPLDYGWLADKPISMILIKNLEGKFPQTQPTEQERLDASAKALEVGYEASEDGFSVLVGETQPFSPSNPSALRIRSKSGIAQYSITVIPG